jgi:hypothetical protein
MRWVGQPLTRSPLITMSPAICGPRLKRASTSVVLPTPLRPRIASTSPGRECETTSRRIVAAP